MSVETVMSSVSATKPLSEGMVTWRIVRDAYVGACVEVMVMMVVVMMVAQQTTKERGQSRNHGSIAKLEHIPGNTYQEAPISARIFRESAGSKKDCWHFRVAGR